METQMIMGNLEEVANNLSEETARKCCSIANEFASAKAGLFEALLESLPRTAGTHLILPLFGVDYREVEGYYNTFFFDPDRPEFNRDVHLKLTDEADLPSAISDSVVCSYEDTDGCSIVVLDKPVEFEKDLEFLVNGDIELLSQEYRDAILAAHEDKGDYSTYGNLKSFFFYLDLMATVAGQAIRAHIQDTVNTETKE